MIKVIYNKTCGRCVQSEPLTSGMVGQTIELEYSADFDGLTLTAVFTNGKTTVDVLNPGNQCVIPHEVLDTVGTLVKVGIYATRGNELVIPTVYATIGVVLKGADPSGDASIDPTLPVWAQTQALIGNLNDLETQAADNLVAAINEVKQTTDTKQDKLIAGENITIAADGKTISATGGGGSVPKPLTYDYMPEGYPTKAMGTVTVIEEHELAFTSMNGLYRAEIENAPKIAASQTYTVSWDGTEYECVGLAFGNDNIAIGNLSIMGAGDNTGEPFVYGYVISHQLGQFGTLDTSASHTISIKRIEEVITPMVYDFMPVGYPSKSGQNTTLMVEQELAFDIVGSINLYKSSLNEALEIVEDRQYAVNWDGTEYKVSAMRDSEYILLGNLAIMDKGADTGEPFYYSFNTDDTSSRFYTLNSSATHTISVTELETITPMAEEFIPTTAKLPNPNPLTFTGAVEGSYDGSEPLTVEIPSGGSGGVDMGITGATVGQIAKITAVDDTGKPTAWSPVNMPTGEEKWEKIAEIGLRTDTAEYVLADFGVWRKAKVIMKRSAYVTGLQKNVWCKVIRENAETYSCGYLGKSYGYVYWEFTAEVNELFISSSALESNNPNTQSNIKSTYTLTPLGVSPSDCQFVLIFNDTSVIQEGDKVTVIGVRR